LSDFEVIKGESEDGKYFVALSYENISTIERFAKKVKASQEVAQNQATNLFLQNTIFGKKLAELLGTTIDFELVRHNQAWFVRYKNAMQYLSKSDFEQFFISHSNDKLSLAIDKKTPILYDGEEFVFKVQSSEDGFITIVSVYEDGTVSTLLKNIPIKKEKPTTFPDDKSESIPVAGILEVGQDTFDMYVALWSPKKENFERFADASEEAIEDEKYKNFGELIEFLQTKRYTTLKVITKPR
jgi:hypothetical protein